MSVFLEFLFRLLLQIFDVFKRRCEGQLFVMNITKMLSFLQQNFDPEPEKELIPSYFLHLKYLKMWLLHCETWKENKS